MPHLIDARCANCGRLLFKFGLGLAGLVEIKCSHASDCKEINEFRIDARGGLRQGLRQPVLVSS